MALTNNSKQPTAGGKNKKLFPKIALLISSLLVYALVAEAVLRLFPQIYHTLNIHTSPYRLNYGYPKGLFISDDILVHRYKPNFKGYFKGLQYEGIPININSMGFRDREYPMEKTEGVYRILGLGDSVTSGDGIRVEDVYLKKLEEQLNNNGTRTKYEIINAAVSRYNNLQELNMLQELAPILHPDFVVVGVIINDIRFYDSQISKAKQKIDITSIDRPVFDLGQHKKVSGFSKLREYSRFIDILALLFKNVMAAAKAHNYLEEYLKACYNAWEGDKWELVKNQLLEFKNVAHDYNFKVLFVLFPSEIQLNFNHEKAIPQVKFINFAQEHDILYLDLFDAFKEGYLKKHEALFIENDDLHLNPVGHKLAAETIYTFLQGNNLLKIN